MKKSLLLIPSVVALSATPFIGLTSCTIGGGGDTPEPTPPEPTEFDFILNQPMTVPTGVGSEDKIKTTEPNTLYTFWIDMNNWGGSKDYTIYNKIVLAIKTQPGNDRLTTTNLQIAIDGNSFDTSGCTIYKYADVDAIAFSSSDIQKLLLANVISGQVQTSSYHSERTAMTCLDFFGE